MPKAVGHDIMYEEKEEGQHRYSPSYLANKFSQFGQLYIEWSLNSSNLCRLACHLAYLRSISHCTHGHHTTSVHHHRRTPYCVRGIGGAVIYYLHTLGDDRFASKRRLVNLQVGSHGEQAVGRNFVAHLKEHHIAHHHIAAAYLRNLSFTHHFYWRFFAKGGEHIKLACGIALKIESNCCGKEDSKKYSYGFHKITLYTRQNK